jgi:hypothetical protein
MLLGVLQRRPAEDQLKPGICHWHEGGHSGQAVDIEARMTRKTSQDSEAYEAIEDEFYRADSNTRRSRILQRPGLTNPHIFHPMSNFEWDY